MKLLNIKCPACGEPVELNGETGQILSHGKKEKGQGLDDAAQSLRAQEQRRLDIFQKSKEDEKSKSERLDKLFSKEEKRVKEEKDFGKFMRDIDLD